MVGRCRSLGGQATHKGRSACPRCATLRGHTNGHPCLPPPRLRGLSCCVPETAARRGQSLSSRCASLRHTRLTTPLGDNSPEEAKKIPPVLPGGMGLECVVLYVPLSSISLCRRGSEELPRFFHGNYLIEGDGPPAKIFRPG